MLGLLRRQLAVTIEGLDALRGWAGGDPAAAEAVRDAEHRGDAAKRELLSALREAFVTPIEPEDVFALSRGIDRILNHARDLIESPRRWPAAPDAGIAEMAGLLGEATRHIDAAIAQLGSDADAPPRPPTPRSRPSGGSSTSTTRGMAALLEVEDMRERISRRELYRRCSQIGETVVDVAERVVYAVVKES